MAQNQFTLISLFWGEKVPDRDKVKESDLVYAVFWDGMFTRFHGKVEKDEDGLFIHTEGDIIGYLKDAYEVRKAVINKGHLCFPHDFVKGCFLVCVPMLQDGSIQWEQTEPKDCLPEPERLERENVAELKQIAQELGCKLY